MHDFYRQMPYEQAVEMERLSRLIYELRVNRDRLLADWQVPDAQTLLERIRAGETAEHPAYEAWLAACTLEDTRRQARRLIEELIGAPAPQ